MYTALCQLLCAGNVAYLVSDPSGGVAPFSAGAAVLALFASLERMWDERR